MCIAKWNHGYTFRKSVLRYFLNSRSHTTKWHQVAKWHETIDCPCPIAIMIRYPHFPGRFKIPARCWSIWINGTTHPTADLPLKRTASLLSQFRPFHSESDFTYWYSELNGNASCFSRVRFNSQKAYFPYCTTGPTTFAWVTIRETFVVFVQ
jgi:hypothetical protein